MKIVTSAAMSAAARGPGGPAPSSLQTHFPGFLLQSRVTPKLVLVSLTPERGRLLPPKDSSLVLLVGNSRSRRFPFLGEHFCCVAGRRRRSEMQRGSLVKSKRKQGPEVWQFRWSEKGPNTKRVYRRRVIGTVEQYPDEAAARRAVEVLVSEINSQQSPSSVITLSSVNWDGTTPGEATQPRRPTRAT